MNFVFDNLDEALVGMSKEVLSQGVSRETRGMKCIEMPTPVIITIKQPTLRVIKNPVRKWSKTLPCAESLWLLNGVNSMDLPGKITKNLYNYSDDGKFMRAAYGPRIRAFSGLPRDYEVKQPGHREYINSKHIYSSGTVDQLRFVIESFERDTNTRQASITIHDPVKDCFDEFGGLKITKDQPCTRLIQFEMKNGAMDCTVYMRSNDLLWGFSAVNVYNFTLLQEIVAGLVGVPIGNYHHVANNFHIYENVKDKIEELADSNFKNTNDPFRYDLTKETFKTFDAKLKLGYHSALEILNPGRHLNPYGSLTSLTVKDDLIDDLLLQLYKWKNKSLNGDNFINPLMR